MRDFEFLVKSCTCFGNAVKPNMTVDSQMAPLSECVQSSCLLLSQQSRLDNSRTALGQSIRSSREQKQHGRWMGRKRCPECGQAFVSQTSQEII